MRIAVLDDYQRAAEGSADWGALADHEVSFVHDHVADLEELAALLEPYDTVVAMRERTAFPAAVFDRLPHLKLLVTTGMSNVAIDIDAAAAAGVMVCGTGMGTTSTAELTWALILALVRHIPEEDVALREGRWQTTIGMELSGRCLGIVGFGRQGTMVATIGQAFGMRVGAWSENLDADRAREAGAEYLPKERLLREADIVTVHYKLGPRSVGIVGADEIALMKPSAYLVNTSRGPVVDNRALATALHEQRIAGAGIDVFEVEPLPPDDPIRTAPRTILTPHLGYVTTAGYERAYGEAIEAIQAYAAGRPVRVLT